MSLPFDVSGARSTDVGSCTVWRAKSFRVLLPLVTAADGANVRCEFSRKKNLVEHAMPVAVNTRSTSIDELLFGKRKRERERISTLFFGKKDVGSLPNAHHSLRCD